MLDTLLRALSEDDSHCTLRIEAIFWRDRDLELTAELVPNYSDDPPSRWLIRCRHVLAHCSTASETTALTLLTDRERPALDRIFTLHSRRLRARRPPRGR